MIPTLVMADGNEEPPPGDHVLLLAGLPEGLHVEAALLGTRWEIAGTPGQCELVLPKAPPTENASGFSRPLSAPDVPGAERAFAWWTQHIDGAEWGMDWHHDARGEPTTAYLRNALILTKYLPPDGGDDRGPFTRDTGATATAWLNAFAEWLEVLCGVDLQPNQPHGPRVGFAYLHNVALGTTFSADRIAAFGYTEPIAHHWTEPTEVTLSGWAMAVTLTNDGAARPAGPHLFLRNARAALHRESERRAVVDACTAVEVALAESIARIHPQAASQPSEVRRAIDTAGGLVRLFDLHQAIAPIENVSRSQVMDRLAGPRNETAHAGAAVTRDHARQALELATTIVHFTSPLPRGVQPRRVVGYVSATGTVSAVE